MLMTTEHVANLERLSRELVGGDHRSRKDYLLLVHMVCDVLNWFGAVPSAYLTNPITMHFAAAVKQPEALLGIELTTIELAEARYVLLKTCFDVIFASKKLTGQELSAAFHCLLFAYNDRPKHIGPSMSSSITQGVIDFLPLMLVTASTSSYGLYQWAGYVIIEKHARAIQHDDPEKTASVEKNLNQLYYDSTFKIYFSLAATLFVLLIAIAYSRKQNQKMSRMSYVTPPLLPRPQPHEQPYASIEEYIKAQIQEQNALNKARKKALRAAEHDRRLEEQAHDTTAPPVEALVSVVTPTHGQRATKENARLLAERQKDKESKRQSRRFGMFGAQHNDIHAPRITTLELTDLQDGATVMIDISTGHLQPEHADYYEIAAYKFILADRNPCLALAPAMQRLLYANQRRGFIGEVAHGQTGLKLFKDGFVVLKAAEEERVLCAIKKLFSVAFNQEIEVIIPVVSIANHPAYERTLQRPNLGAWLRGLVDNRVQLEENLELHEEAFPEPQPRR